LNPGLPEYKVGMLPTRPRCSVCPLRKSQGEHGEQYITHPAKRLDIYSSKSLHCN